MIPESDKPDISNLVRSGHFYFGWTQLKDRLDNQCFIREFSGLQSGIELFAVFIDFKTSIVEGNQLKGRNPLFPGAENFFRQTDGSWFVVSFCAIFNFKFHARQLLM